MAVASVLINQVVIRHSPFRELLSDSVEKSIGGVIEGLVAALQAEQTTPVLHRPNLVGLVERYNNMWKHILVNMVNENQEEWDEWLPAAAYAYNSAVHRGVGLVYELMYRRLSHSPSDLLLANRVGSADDLQSWHGHLRQRLILSHSRAREAIVHGQRCQAHIRPKSARRNPSGYRGVSTDVPGPPRTPDHLFLTCLGRIGGGTQSRRYDNFLIQQLGICK